MPIRGLVLPDDLASLLVERDDLGVELADKDLAVAECNAAAGLADRTAGPRIDMGPVVPEDLAGLDIHRKGIVGAVHDIDDALIFEDLSLAGIPEVLAGAHMTGPDRLELGDIVLVDLGERRIALIFDRAAIGDPPIRRQGRQILRLEGGRLLDHHIVGSGSVVRDETERERGHYGGQKDGLHH